MRCITLTSAPSNSPLQLQHHHAISAPSHSPTSSTPLIPLCIEQAILTHIIHAFGRQAAAELANTSESARLAALIATSPQSDPA